MTSGLGILITGGSPPTLPPAEPVLEAVGVDGYDHRWHADIAAYANLAPNGTISAWDDYVDASPDNLQRQVLDVGAPEPTLMSESIGGKNYNFVRYSGVDQVGAQRLTPPKAFWVVFRVDFNLLPVSRIAGATISRASNGQIRVVPVAGTVYTGGIASTTLGWHAIVGNADPTGFAYTLDGVDHVMGTYTPGPPGNMTTATTMTTAPAPLGSLYGDLRDRGTFPFLLSSAQRASVYAALKAQNPFLP